MQLLNWLCWLQSAKIKACIRFDAKVICGNDAVVYIWAV